MKRIPFSTGFFKTGLSRWGLCGGCERLAAQDTVCKRSYQTVSATVIALTLFALTAPGCRQKDEGFEVLTLAGKVEKIELNGNGTGQISVLYHSDRHDQDLLGTGLITSETEILINGVVASLRDIREGEQVRGEVRVEKSGDTSRRIAMKIYVDRATPIPDDKG